MDIIRKKLEVCLAEKEKLERLVDDLAAQLEEEKFKAMKEGVQQMDFPSLSSDMPVVNLNDQLELKAMVDAIAAASQREAEAHETAIMLSKENDELRMKLKVLIEDNNKLIELYEQAASENNIKTVNKAENAQEIGDKVDNTENETKLKRVVENLEHQLVELNEENEKLMGLYEKAMQERDEFKRILSSCAHERVETEGEMDCHEKLVEVDAGKRDSGVSGCQNLQCRTESRDLTEPTLSRSSLCAENGQDEENQTSQRHECIESDEPTRHVEEKILMEESDLITEPEVNNEVDVLVYSDMDIELSNLTAAKLSQDLNCAREKLGEVDEKISDTVRTLAALGCAEKAFVGVDKFSREIEVIEQDIDVKRQQFESLKLLLSEAQERRTLVDKKFPALKYSLSSFSSSFSYFEQREVRAREAVNALTSYLDHKKGKLAALQASKHGIENAQKKNQELEVELLANIARIKSKLEEENRKRESEKALFAIDNKENNDCSQRNWHLSSKAIELLKSEEEKTKLREEMKLFHEKLVIIRKELGNLNKKAANVETEIQAVQLEIQKGLKNAEEKGLVLERVMNEKNMLLEFRDNGMTEIENIILEFQQHVFESDLKEAEIRVLEEELDVKLVSAEKLRSDRANKKTQLSDSASHSSFTFEKIAEELQDVRESIIEAKSLLEKGSSHAPYMPCPV